MRPLLVKLYTKKNNRFLHFIKQSLGVSLFFGRVLILRNKVESNLHQHLVWGIQELLKGKGPDSFLLLCPTVRMEQSGTVLWLKKKKNKPDGFLFMFSEIFSCRCRNSRTNHVVDKTIIHSKTLVIKATVFFEVGEKKMKRLCCLLVWSVQPS